MGTVEGEFPGDHGREAQPLYPAPLGWHRERLGSPACGGKNCRLVALVPATRKPEMDGKIVEEHDLVTCPSSLEAETTIYKRPPQMPGIGVFLLVTLGIIAAIALWLFYVIVIAGPR